MENTLEKPNKAAEEEKPLAEFSQLISTVAELPKDKIEKVTIFTQGFIAGSACK